MACCKMSGTPAAFGLVIFLLTVQVIGTEALFSWFGSGRNSEQQAETESREEYGSRSTTTTGLHRYHFDIESPAVLSGGTRGKELYEKAVALGTAQSCWQQAYTGLEGSCREILRDESKKSRLAFRFTNCFLKSSGRPLLKKCLEQWPIASCVKELDDHNHAIFLAFYIDSSAMCHYLQSQEFKMETEQLVNNLKVSAHYTEDKLNVISHQLDKRHETILEQSASLLNIQKQIHAEHALLQESIEEGMENLQEAAGEAQEQLNLVNKYQKAIAQKQQELAGSLQLELSKLQQKSNQLGSSMTDLYGSVEELTEKSLSGQEEAKQSLSQLQHLQVDAIAESKLSLNALVEEALRHKDEFRGWQLELDKMHHRLVAGSTSMIKTQETFATKQAAIFATMERLFSLHNSILLESRAVKTLMIYFALSIFVYMATTTKQTQNARVQLYCGLFMTLAFEVWLIRFSMGEIMEKLKPHSMEFYSPLQQLVWIRYTYGVFALGYLGYTYFNHKDYEYLSYTMLKDIHNRFGDHSQLQEKLFVEYMAKREIFKDLRQVPNERHSISKHESDLNNSEHSIQSTANHGSLRSVASSRSRSKEASPVSSASLRPRRRPIGSGHY